MTIIAFTSPKSKVGKSALARALAHQIAHRKFYVLLADCDPRQVISYNRLKSKQKDKMTVQFFTTAQQILREASKYDLTIIDGPTRTNHTTLEIAQKADLVIQPTTTNRNDLALAVKEFDSLVEMGVTKNKLIFVFNRIATLVEEISAKQYLSKRGYLILTTALREENSCYQVQGKSPVIAETIHVDFKARNKELIQEIFNLILDRGLLILS